MHLHHSLIKRVQKELKRQYPCDDGTDISDDEKVRSVLRDKAFMDGIVSHIKRLRASVEGPQESSEDEEDEDQLQLSLADSRRAIRSDGVHRRDESDIDEAESQTAAPRKLKRLKRGRDSTGGGASAAISNGDSSGSSLLDLLKATDEIDNQLQ